jgi:hypothetical protein
MTKTTFTPGEWTLNGNQLIAVHRDRYGDHETLVADIFTEHDWARANARLLRAAPIMHDKLLDAKRHLENARSEVDQGVNDPLEVSTLLTLAAVSALLTLAFEAVDAALATAKEQR